MKKYIAPSVRINYVSHKHEIVTTSLQIWEDIDANPEEPILIKRRDQDWENWE